MPYAPAPMTRPRHQPLRRRLQAGLLALCFMAVGLGAFVGGTLGSVVQQLQLDIHSGDTLEHAARDLQVALLRQETSAGEYLLTGNAGSLGAFRTARADEGRAIDRLYAAAGGSAMVGSISAVARAAEEWRDTWVSALIALVADGRLDEARRAASSPAGAQLSGEMAAAMRRLDSRIASGREAVNTALADAQSLIVTAVLLAVVIGAGAVIAAGAWVLLRLSTPLERMVRTAEALEQGEEVSFSAERNDEIGALSGSLQRLQSSLRRRYEAAAETAERGAIFNQVSELISYADDEESIVSAASAAVQRIGHSPVGDLLLINSSRDQLRVAARWGNAAQPINSPLAEVKPSKCPGIRRGVTHHTSTSDDGLSLACQVHPATIGQMVCVPIVAHGEPIGVVHLERDAAQPFETEEVQTVTRIIEQIGLALANLRLVRKMESQAMTDPLTGLANPRFFDPLLDRELGAAHRDGASVGLLAMDLDHFKDFNDKYGHPAGDEALRVFAKTLRSHLREADTAARYGGEEFSVALHNTELPGAATIAEKLRMAVSAAPVEISPGRFARIAVSIGVAASAQHGSDRLTLMKAADRALYRAKNGGRNAIALAGDDEPAVSARPPVVLLAHGPATRPAGRTTRG